MLENVKAYALLLTPECITVRDPHSSSRTIRISVVAITQDGKIRNGIDGVWYDFQFGAQWNTEDDSKVNRHTYAWEGAYRAPYHVGLREAERMVKHLRRLKRAHEAYCKLSSGRDTFGIWLEFAAEKLGISEARLQVRPGGNWNYDSSEYATLTLSEATAWIDDQIDSARGRIMTATEVV
jgi:hypothetical protein